MKAAQKDDQNRGMRSLGEAPLRRLWIVGMEVARLLSEAAARVREFEPIP